VIDLPRTFDSQPATHTHSTSHPQQGQESTLARH